jgi:hypothetical protein
MANPSTPVEVHNCFTGVLFFVLHSKVLETSVTVRVGQNRIYTPYMTVYLMISLQKIPYIHTVYIWFWPTLVTVLLCELASVLLGPFILILLPKLTTALPAPCVQFEKLLCCGPLSL